MLALCLMLLKTYHAQDYAGIIGMYGPIYQQEDSIWRTLKMKGLIISLLLNYNYVCIIVYTQIILGDKTLQEGPNILENYGPGSKYS